MDLGRVAGSRTSDYHRRMYPYMPLRNRVTLSPQHRILAVIGGLIVVAFVVIAASYALTEGERADLQADVQTLDALQSDVTQLTAAARNQELSVDEYVLSAGPTTLGDYRAAVDDEIRLVAAIRTSAAELPAIQAAVGNVSGASAAWRSDFAEPTITAVSTNGSGAMNLFVGRYAIGLSGAHRTHDELNALANQLDQANANIYARTSGLSAARTAGTAVGLGALLAAAASALFLMRRYGNALEQVASRADILNRFTEITVFAPDDAAIAASNLEALALLVHPDDAVVHVLNHSQDRALPLATLGAPPTEVLAMSSLSRCPGVMRGSVHVTPDVTRPLSVRCPVYVADKGTVACVPLAHGDTVGATHLHWQRSDALALDLWTNVARVAEHAALAIGNRRLLQALKGQASTDARTGLANSRAFDRALEDWLLARASTESAAVLMLDLDHFKDFNDRHGHPAGDEALRVFADVVRSCVRDGDVAARYGGEEFAILLPNLELSSAFQVAERIRAQTEATIIPIGPGITDRITVSIGVAASPADAQDRLMLLRTADSALYRAKRAGRNRVATAERTERHVPSGAPDEDAQSTAPAA